MTFEENLDRFAELNQRKGRESFIGPAEYAELEELRNYLIGDYELLESEYRSWSALALAWFKWADGTDAEDFPGFRELVDRTIINVG